MLTPDQMNALAQAQASKLRVVRRALPPVIGQRNGYNGEYRVIVSPYRYSQAYRRRAGRSALIHEIQALLPNNGFLSSSILRGNQGVIFSLARGTVRLSVPVDTYVDTSIPNDDQGRQRFRVAQHLMLDDPYRARVALR